MCAGGGGGWGAGMGRWAVVTRGSAVVEFLDLFYALSVPLT